jgi:hypothetical protein
MRCISGRFSGWGIEYLANVDEGQVEAKFFSDKAIPVLGAVFNEQYFWTTYRGFEIGNMTTVHNIYELKY